MVWLERRGKDGVFFACFRFGGQRFNRSLDTDDEKIADGLIAWIKGNIRAYELGQLDLPDDTDVPTFLLTDGRRQGKLKLADAVTLARLFKHYFDSIPAGSRELTTVNGMKIHQKHLQRHLGQAPEVFNITQEPQHVLDLYGTTVTKPESFGAQCLMARRLVERGVRVVYLFDVGSNSNWDNHSNMSLHSGLSRNVDQPIAGLVRDLKQRGLLDETLIVGCTEFGRTPWEDQVPEGRGHFNRNFTCFLAGGGAKGGHSYGVSDEYGATAVENPVHTHDFHATILHLMGLDHTRLTYRYSGRDFRLTDVHGNVVHGVIA